MAYQPESHPERPDDRVTVHAVDEFHTILQDDGVFPNNALLPLLAYRGAVDLPARDAAAGFETLFTANLWPSAWRNGVYGFHHYHSTAHEVLGVYSGSATVQLGGDKGITLTIARGDVLVIPAGVAHRNLGSSDDFRVVGGYPTGQHWDTCYGKPHERPGADHRIRAVYLPQCDPVYGTSGPLVERWKGNKNEPL